jgi:hypothetical protein
MFTQEQLSIINDVVIGVIVSIDSYIMYKLGMRSVEKRIQKFIKRISNNPEIILSFIHGIINNLKEDEELKNSLNTFIAKSIMSIKEDQQVRDAINELTKVFINSALTHIKENTPHMLEELRKNYPAVDSVLKLLEKRDQKDNTENKNISYSPKIQKPVVVKKQEDKKDTG